MPFQDAVCVPLRAEEGAPLGALHVYKEQRAFTEHQFRFCEALAGCLANNLRVLRSRRALEADNSRLQSSVSATSLFSANPSGLLIGNTMSNFSCSSRE